MGLVSFRRAAWLSALVAGMVLAFAVPSIALAVNTATFKSPVPASTSWIHVANPTISLSGYDRYGVRASGISMWVAGRRVTPTFTYNNLGKKSFRLSYPVPAALSNGAVRVTVKVKDFAGKLSSTSWLFNVDTIAPVTIASGTLPTSPGLGAVSLSATDGGSGVKHTYWTLDNGAAMESSILVTLDVGSHHVDYWSVDIAGNVETPKTLSTTVVSAPAIMHKSATGALSSACTTCHRDNLATVHANAEFGGCGCHTASFLTARMAAFMAPGATPAECVSCHAGTHAAHAFGDSISGHSTTTYGKKGVYTKFDGSQGVTLKDSEGDTVTTDWDFPSVNVFWAATDTAAPATAIKGLTKDSVVSCQDCHVGLNTVAGPHGAAEQFGIDPNYDYPFKYAIVGGPAGAVSATDGSLNYTAPGQTPKPGRFAAATPTTSTAGIPASASGIKARIAANLGTVAAPIKSVNPADLMITNYENYPDYKGAEYIADATSGQYAVICAKCHDLYNWTSKPTTTSVDQGWGNAGPDNYEGMHGAHAGGTSRNGNDVGRIDGRSDCVNCHVAVPHAWRQPRLLVNGYTGPIMLGGGWIGGVLVPPTTSIASVADPFPYFQGRGMPLFAGANVVAPAPAVSPGNGPNDAKDDHAANAYGKPVWEEAACVSCSGSSTSVGWAGLEHRGLTTEPAKIR